MKWENRNIHVVERANVPKLSKLSDIVTPIRFIKLSLIMYQLIWVLVTPSCTVIKRKQTLLLKLLKKNSLRFKHATA